MNDTPDFELVEPRQRDRDGNLVPDPRRPPSVRLRAWSPEAAAFIRDHAVTAVQIPADWRGGGRLDFLASLAGQLRRLSVASREIADLAAISDLEALEYVSVAGAVETIDFSRLQRLATCVLGPARSVGNVADAPALETLHLDHVPLTDLVPLAGAPKLATLTLSETRRLRSLDGVAALSLRKLSVGYASRLTTIGDLAESATLEELFFERTPAVTDVERLGAVTSLVQLDFIGGPGLPGFEWLTGLSELRSLAVQGTREIDPSDASLTPIGRLAGLRVLLLRGARTELRALTAVDSLGALAALETLVLGRLSPIPTLAFVRNLRALRDVRIERTTVVDGDLSPLLDLPLLERVTVDPPRRGYSHTSEELRAALSARRPEVPIQRPSMRERIRELNALRRKSKGGDSAR